MKKLNRFLLFVLAFGQVFVFSGFVHANIKKLSDVTIPSQYGIMREKFDALTSTGTDKAGQERIIIHIQDAHCNYEAQKNMAKLLEYLVKEYGLKLIMVEGGQGDVGLSFLRSYADTRDRERIADKYLKQGQISGEEYLDITSDYKLDLYGIEDQELYNAHVSAFFTVDTIKDKALRSIRELTQAVEALKPYMYSKELFELEKKAKGYEDKAISLAEYCQYLNEMAVAQKLKFDDYYRVSSFAKIAAFEKGLDFKQAETERNGFIKELGSRINEAQLQDLLTQSQEFKSGKISPYRYYSFLKDLSASTVDLEHSYPHLYSYIRYIKLSKDTNTAEIIKELNSVTEKLRESFSADPAQKKLSDIAKGLKVLEMMLTLELTPEDYEYFKAHKDNFVTSSWEGFLSENCRRYSIAFQSDLTSIIDHNMENLENFYQLGIRREKAFIKNVAKKMSESGEKIAVLITGGFHTPGISKMLKEQGYSYIVMAPVVTQKGDPNIYLSVLRGQKNTAFSGSEEYVFDKDEE